MSESEAEHQWERTNSAFYLPERPRESRSRLETSPTRMSPSARLDRLSLTDRYWRQEKDQAYKQDTCSPSPTRSFNRHLPVKAERSLDTLDLAQTRERDVSIASRQPPVKRVDVTLLDRKENKPRMSIQQEGERVRLRQRCLEMDRDEALNRLQHWTIESNALREQLKVISQDRAMNDRIFQVQRVEELQETILKLDKESCEYRQKISELEENMLGLSEENRTLARKLDSSQEELQKIKDDQCKATSEAEFSDTQRDLMAKSRELKSVEERKKHLEERNDTLSKQVSSLREEAHALQATVFQFNQEKGALQRQLDDKEKLIGKLKLTVEKVEISEQSLQQAMRGRDEELEAIRKNLTEMMDNLNATTKEKEAALQAKAQLKDHLDKAYLDHKALQFKMDESRKELETMHRKLQDYITETSCTDKLILSKACSTGYVCLCPDKLIERLQLTAGNLEASAVRSLQKALAKAKQDMEAVQQKLSNTEQDLDNVRKEKEFLQEVDTQVCALPHPPALDSFSTARALLQSREGSGGEMEIILKKMQKFVSQNFRSSKPTEEVSPVVLRLAIEELEEKVKLCLTTIFMTRNLQHAVDTGERGLEETQKKLAETEENLDKVMKEKQSMQESNTQLRGELDKAQLDIQAGERKMEESGKELEELKENLQQYDLDMACIDNRMSFKVRAGPARGGELLIETSLKQAVNRGEKDLEAVWRKLNDAQGELDVVMREKASMLKANTSLRADLDRAELENKALQRKVDMSNQNVRDLQRELQSFSTDFSGFETWFTSSEEAIVRLQLTFEGLEMSAMDLRKVVHSYDLEMEAEWRCEAPIEEKEEKEEEEELAALGREESLAAGEQS
ncbi:hypothetical protein JZ751_028983 [Albula glossodonta]|uniref:Uncharacterized protein n=1 Tax=Albula glossodonta TaxID=121402 RepID=A0A8T2PAB7_9TELE|nr:hypothetical protein JZ751_028983 [Albula glossodonta]